MPLDLLEGLVVGKKIKIIAKYSKVMIKNNINSNGYEGRERMREGNGDREERGREMGGLRERMNSRGGPDASDMSRGPGSFMPSTRGNRNRTLLIF